MAEKKDGTCFSLGLHVYRDASQLSWSGGTLHISHGRREVELVRLIAGEYMRAELPSR